MFGNLEKQQRLCMVGKQIFHAFGKHNILHVALPIIMTVAVVNLKLSYFFVTPCISVEILTHLTILFT